MHFTPWPRWLRMVSTATVVFPVLRSPMISSRWPRPIGIMASMALMPVCSGWCTGLRPMMPGAWISTRRSMPPTIGPLPSTGSPSALTTRPSSASPTGTDRMRPVERTVWPSSMEELSPSTTAPIDSSSRLSASPTVPSSNSSSSLTAASGRPETRAMPSPTSVTRPTVWASSEGSKPSSPLVRAAVMSSAEMVSSAMVVLRPERRESVRLGRGCSRGGGSEEALHLIEAAADGAVDDGVADGGHEAAEDGGVDDDLQLDLLAGGVGQGGGEALLLVVREGHGRAHLGHGPLLGGGGPLDQAVDDRRQVAAAPGADDQGHELRGGGRGLAAEQVLDDGLALGRRDLLIGQDVAQRVRGLDAPGEAEELVLHLVQRPFGVGDLEEGLGVAVDAVGTEVGAHDAAPTRAMKSSTSCCCSSSSSDSPTTCSVARAASSATSACTSLCSRPWTESISLSALAKSSATSCSSRVRPSLTRRAACASASASIRWRSASMSPFAARIDVAASSAPAFAPAASSSCAWMRAVRAFIICWAWGQPNFHSRKATIRNDSVPQMSSGASGKIQLLVLVWSS